MREDVRNSRAVTILIVCMTLGALALLLLEPGPPAWSRMALLSAETAADCELVVIDFVLPGANDLSNYECVISPDGEAAWQRSGSELRMAVVGDGSDKLPPAQVDQLLGTLGALRYRSGLDLRNVLLGSDSDPAIAANLPPQAHDLHALLVRKGILR